MPDIDGLEVCGLIRAHVSCPIIFLTARIEESDAVTGFAAGGDDYVTKPFRVNELGARVEAHLRRKNRDGKAQSFRFFGRLTIDYAQRQVLYQNAPIPLTKTEFDIVELLSRDPGQVFDKERIYERIWGYDIAGNSSIVVEHIRRIRNKLLRYSQDEYISTVWGVGYRWEK